MDSNGRTIGSPHETVASTNPDPLSHLDVNRGHMEATDIRRSTRLIKKPDFPHSRIDVNGSRCSSGPTSCSKVVPGSKRKRSAPVNNTYTGDKNNAHRVKPVGKKAKMIASEKGKTRTKSESKLKSNRDDDGDDNDGNHDHAIPVIATATATATNTAITTTVTATTATAITTTVTAITIIKQTRKGKEKDQVGNVIKKRRSNRSAMSVEIPVRRSNRQKTRSTQEEAEEEEEEEKEKAVGGGDQAEEITTSGRRYWLMKAEPEPRFVKGVDVSFSIDQLHEAADPQPWDGEFFLFLLD